VNAELMQNAFRSGYYKNSEKFRDIPLFPYREDNRPKATRTLVFEKDFSGNDVDLTFQLSTIPFNSRLNAQIIRELGIENWTELVQE
jgi:hypothetical protein